MGKNLVQQRRGKGNPQYLSPGFRSEGAASLPGYSKTNLKGKILSFVKCQAHSSVLMRVKYDNSVNLTIAPQGVYIGDTVEIGNNVKIQPGNVLPLKNIPDGTNVCNIESLPGDGGKFARSSGAFGKIASKAGSYVTVMFPSKKEKKFFHACRAMIGISAGGQRTEKPFLKAGTKYYAMRAKKKLWPITGGVNKNAVDHPYGGSSSHHKGKPLIAPKNAPPGRKVGAIRPKSTGKKR